LALRVAQLTRDPRFLVGLLLRAVLVLSLQPVIRSEWFIPFLGEALRHPLDPWTAHLASGGSPMAFPYGPMMLLLLGPLTWLGLGLDQVLGADAFAHIGFGAGILVADLLLLEALLRLAPARARQILSFYWLSPITLFVCYWHGQTDVVPLALLMWALLALRELRPARAGALLGAAIATKLTIVLAAPFLLIYLYGNKRLRPLLVRFAGAAGLVAAGLQGPYLLSEGVRTTVFGSPELEKIYVVSVDLGGGLHVYLLPVVYALTVFAVWRVRRMSAELLTALLGVAFFLVVLMTPASPGWFLWVVPFLALLRFDQTTTRVLVYAFSALYLGFHLVVSAGPQIPALGLDPAAALATLRDALPPHPASLWLSTLIAAGVVVALAMAREGIERNDYFRLSRKPLVIGVAGDSGAGKDTLAEALAGLFGDHSVARVSGDDYHHWDRHKPMWQVMTHLNPRANDLYRFTQDVRALADGHTIVTPHYDHDTGRFTQPRRVLPNDVLVVNGLHALYVPELRDRYDLRIYLDMHDGLRRHFKALRDVSKRRHDPEALARVMERREGDAERFIRPQRERADVVFSLLPIRDDLLEREPPPDPVPLKLRLLLRRGVYYEPLVRVLIGVCGLHVDVVLSRDSDDVEITIEGDVSPEDVAMAARELLPEVDELLDLRPRWRDGMTGLMQLISLAQALQSLRERIR
jgi:uridine kinase